ncbi:MAG: kinase [Gammaproteobacteria bacterium]|nr:kinase [Gammaproteobacteria bacterium]MDE0225249.1 kinase [Gammaproteobacteria bacterium]
MSFVVDDAARACFDTLDPAIPQDWRTLAANLAVRWHSDPPRRVGLAGGQGAGKSTLSRAIVEAGRHFGLRVVSLSIDDFYLTRSEREALADRVHPLLATRGPPGTHDVPLCESVMDALDAEGVVTVPVFDKGLDNRAPETLNVQAPVDVVLLEGWCVGARPEPADRLDQPINALEAESDSQGLWRRHINQALATDYARLFGRFDCLVFLRVPNLDAVVRWRLQQESERPPERRLDKAEVAHFVAHYERLTRWMLEDLPARAAVVVELDEGHQVTGCTLADRQDPTTTARGRH